MKPVVSDNGFTFTASVGAKGEQLTLVAHKEDHEGRKTIAFTFDANDAKRVLGLVELLKGNLDTAHRRRKAIRKAKHEAHQGTSRGPSPEQP